MTPFWIRRPLLLVRDMMTNRDRPDLQALERIAEPEAFVWAILPHAARTFAACIALLPARAALAAAVAYLYSRMLDTYEDLVPDRVIRDEALRDFAARLDCETDGTLPSAPAIEHALDRDDRDRAHLLLVRRADLVDRVYLGLDPEVRAVVRELVREMSEGMRWSAAAMERQGGLLASDEQLSRYCRHVLGNPVVFSVQLMRLHHGQHPGLQPAEREAAMRVGEMVQLANITRDVEKDLRRGIAYDASLRDYLGRDPVSGDSDLAERCRSVRERLLRFALVRAPSYGRIIDALHLPRWSVARASAILMLLFTERYFRGCARRVGWVPWNGPSTVFGLFRRSFLAAFSAQRARSEIERVERAFLAAAGTGLPVAAADAA